jgi:tetratricopeptide (TPR) repeat protein
LGHTLLELERPAEAKIALEQALSLDPASAAASFQLGRIALQQGDLAQAVEYFEAVLQLQPAASIARYPLATAYRGQGRLKDAEEQLALRGQRKVAIADPLIDELRVISTGARVHLFRGALAMRSRNLSAALQEFGKAVEMAPDNSRARLNFGAALAQSGQVDRAVEQLEQALQLGLDAENRSKTHFNLGALERLAGRPDAAREHLREAVRWNPRNQPAQEMLDALSASSSATP